MNLLLDTMVLGRLVYPREPRNQPVVEWLGRVLETRSGAVTLLVPEVCDYELRRGLLHLALKEGGHDHPRLRRLDALEEELEYLPITTAAMRRAAKFWAQARARGRPTADDRSLDSDMILAAQAAEVSGLVVTDNPHHLDPFVPACRWDEVEQRL